MKNRKLHLTIIIAILLASLAYNFLWRNRLQAGILDCTTAVNITVTVQECVGLVDLFNSTEGSGRTTATNWISDTDVCTRHGVTCAYVDTVIHVVDLSLPNNNLIGTLPPSMSWLNYLLNLNLRHNEISGTLPDERSSMIKIEKMDLSDNIIGWVLPASWSWLFNMEEFTLAANNLTGTLPASWETWIELSGFNLSNNTLQGELPIEWKNRTSIRSFNLANNQLSGTLKTEWSLQTLMYSFNVSGNALRWELPSSWGSARSWLESVIVTNNNFIGDIPASWADLSELNELQLDYNCFNIDLPEPPASFVDDVAGTEWQDRQTHCIGDLTIEKSVDLTQALPGSQLVYTLRYINNSIHDIPGVVVSDTLPSDVIYVSSPTTSGLIITWSAISRQIGRVAPQSSNIVKVVVQVKANVTSGTIIGNSASIIGLLFDTGASNDISNTVQTLIFGITAPTFGWGGGGNPPILPPVLPTSSGYTSTTSNPPVPPVKTKCPYENGHFSLYKNTFIDVPAGIYKKAVDTLLDYCLIEGFYNEGKIFGTYSFVKRGEAYKIYYRLTGLPIIPPPSNDIHRADTYRKGWDKIRLRASISAGVHPVNSNISYADVYTIANNLLRYFNKAPLEYISGINYGDGLTRGAFALFLQAIIEKISE